MRFWENVEMPLIGSCAENCIWASNIGPKRRIYKICKYVTHGTFDTQDYQQSGHMHQCYDAKGFPRDSWNGGSLQKSEIKNIEGQSENQSGRCVGIQGMDGYEKTMLAQMVNNNKENPKP